MCKIIADGFTKFQDGYGYGHQFIAVIGLTDSYLVGDIIGTDNDLIKLIKKDIAKPQNIEYLGYDPEPCVPNAMHWAWRSLLKYFDEKDITIEGEMPHAPYEYEEGVKY